MKKRIDRWLALLVGIVGSAVIRMWMATLRVRVEIEPEVDDPRLPGCRQHYLFALWHDGLLLPTCQFGNLRGYTLISQSKDGEYITQVARRLGWTVIRGSSSRGGSAALRQLLEIDRSNRPIHVAITCDGPRGPRHVMKSGAIYVAGKSGLQIIPVGVACHWAWKAKSWDRFMLPLPFSRATVVGGNPIAVPDDLDSQTVEQWRDRLQEEMDRVQRKAESACGRPVLVTN